jgi:rod shape-determining protein MreC
MSYLLDKKIRQRKYTSYFVLTIVLLLLFYFQTGVFRSLSYVGHTIFRPVLVVGNAVGGKFSGVGSFFSSRNTLINENQNLREQIIEKDNNLANYNSILSENVELKETLGRKENPNTKDSMVLGAILSKPNVSLYDTLVIDIGTSDGVKVGDMVFAKGSVPIGKIDIVYGSTSKVVLFSTSKENTEVIISGKNIYMQLVGRGGGNFEMILPRDFSIDKGTEVVLPGIHAYTVATAETILSDPRDSFAKALFVSPVNIQELKFVEVRI